MHYLCKFYFFFEAKKAAKENALERKIELHEQTIQKQNLRVKELEYELQNYHEYQHQAKVCYETYIKLFIKFFHFMRWFENRICISQLE